MTVAFQRDDSEQIVDRIIDVSTVLRRRSLRNTVKALQAHHVIDPQAAGVAHVGAHQIDERPVAVLLKF
jgi:hypothetical protein